MGAPFLAAFRPPGPSFLSFLLRDSAVVLYIGLWTSGAMIFPLGILLLFLSFLSPAAAIPTWERFASRESITSLIPGSSFIEALGVINDGSQAMSRRRLYLNAGGSDAKPGEPGNAMVYWTKTPSRFYLSPKDGQLYQVTNETSILHVNVLNATVSEPSISSPSIVPPGARPGAAVTSSDASESTRQPRVSFTVQDPSAAEGEVAAPAVLPPLRLVLDSKPGGMRGTWRWQSTMLIFEAGSPSNSGTRASNGGVYYLCTDADGKSGVYMFLEPSATPEGCGFTTMHGFNHAIEDRRTT